MLLNFPGKRRRHGRASAVSKSNNSGLGFWPNFSSASEKIMNFPDGMRPRERQLLTADSPTPAKAATTEVPPSASMISSTDISIPLEYSRFVNLSSVHNNEIFTGCELRPNRAMSRALKDVAKRLVITRRAWNLSGAQIARDTTITETEWSQYIHPEKYKRRISVEHALELKDKYGASLDWIFDGDISSLREDLAIKIRKAIKAIAA